jgi:tripartite-type tricarboxylate transporter receptor subunit TctC
MLRLTRRALLTMAALACTLAAQAQSDKTVRFILPVATASGVDTITRTVSQALSKAIGNPIVIENQPGAGGIVGTAALVKSAPDGYTLSIVSNNHVIYPSVYKSVPFDPLGDITPIAVIGATPLVLVANPKVPASNAKELAALLKAKPGAYNYASSGNGTILHLTAEMFLEEAGAQAKHIPYKGVGPMVTDLIGGQVEFGVVSLPSAQTHIKSGALRALGIGSQSRIAAAPDIPTFIEQGYNNLVMDAWFAMIAPKGLPAADVKRLNQALQTAFATADVKEAMAKQGNTINISTHEHAVTFFRNEMMKYAKLVKKAGLELQ